MNNEVSLTVTDINNYIKNIVDGDFFLSNVTLKGEISNLKFHTRGHLYFSLKDENSKINAVMFNYKNLGLNFIPKDGMNVIVKGKVSVFTTGGSYQITVSNMKEDGIGNLYILFEELKRRLEREGLFSPEHKKKLPRIPKKVGVITASTGAAVKDIISTINRRFPLTEIILFPTLVQGVGAKENIVKMINEANESDVDVIILGRGGGSIEDLWAFNEEIVARAIYNSNKPIVSAVGHEIDFTISDFVSDMRAPTPTGAAELVVPSKVEIQSYLNDYKGRIISVINKKIKSYTDTFSKLKSTYILKNPISMYEIDEQKLDNMLEKLGSIMTYKLEREKSKLNNLSKMISPNILNRLDKEKIKLENIETKLKLLNPENILKKGYSLTLVEGKIVKSINSVKKGSIIDTKFSDGIIKSEVL
jgi:exodeoxyribonuclease VII large subunit